MCGQCVKTFVVKLSSTLFPLSLMTGFINIAVSKICNKRPTQPSIPPGSVNEYQLRLGSKRQVWFIPLADVLGVCR